MRVVVHTDGGSRGNPGAAAIGVVVDDLSTKKTLLSLGKCIGVTTNNVAEYSAVLAGLNFIATLPHHQIESCDFFADSLLIISQITGKYKVKNLQMQTLCSQVQNQLRSLPFSVTFTYVPRAQNATADALVNKALDENIDSVIRQEK